MSLARSAPRLDLIDGSGSGTDGLHTWSTEARARFNTTVESFPASLATWCKAAHASRTARAQAAVRWGECLPLFIAEAVGANKEQRDAFTTPWLLAYAHALAADDLDDGEMPYSHTCYCEELLSKAVAAMAGLPDPPEQLPELHASLLKRMRRAGRDSQRARSDALCARDLEGWLAEKSSLIDLGLTYLTFRATGSAPTVWQRTGLSKLASCVQMLDDLSDLERDLQRTPETWTAMRAFQSNTLDPDLINHWPPENLECMIVVSGVIEWTCERVRQGFRKGLRLLAVDGESELARIVALTDSHVVTLQKEAERLSASPVARRARDHLLAAHVAGQTKTDAVVSVLETSRASRRQNIIATN